MHWSLIIMLVLLLEQIRHNIAVAEYYRDGCTNPQKLLEVLAQVKVCEHSDNAMNE